MVQHVVCAVLVSCQGQAGEAHAAAGQVLQNSRIHLFLK
jgi:hypothetical protein